MEIPEQLLNKIMKVLIHNVGDTRECPFCSRSFTIKDKTATDSFDVYKELKQLIDGDRV